MSVGVFLEHHEGELQKGALGVLGKAASLDGDVVGIVLGSGVKDLASLSDGAPSGKRLSKSLTNLKNSGSSSTYGVPWPSWSSTKSLPIP